MVTGFQGHIGGRTLGQASGAAKGLGFGMRPPAGLGPSPSDDPVAQEIKDTIEALNDDEQAELVALTWIGRGDYTVDEWNEVVRTARQRRTNPTADYLLGTPMLGDYLEEGLTELGLTVEDLEPART